MTNAVALILVVLSCRGYWFGGAEAQVALSWAVDKPPVAVVTWELMADQAKLAGVDREQTKFHTNLGSRGCLLQCHLK